MLMRTDPFRDLAGFARAFDQMSTAPSAPMDAYRLGDVVTVRILGVDLKKERISLTMKGIKQK